MLLMACINVVSWNAHSLRSSSSEFFEFLHDNHVDVAGVSETWSTFSPGMHQGFRDGFYEVGFSHPSGRRGVSVFCALSSFQMLQSFSFQEEDLTVISLLLRGVVFVFVYIPRGNNATGMNRLMSLYYQMYQLYEKIIILGDLNAKLPNGNQCGVTLARWLHTRDIWRYPLNLPSFTAGSTLDHCLFSDGCRNLISSCAFVHELDSDHYPMLLSIVCGSDSPPLKLCTRWRLVATLLESHLPTWSPEESIDSQVQKFQDTFSWAVQKSSKPRLSQRHQFAKVAWTPDLKRLKQARNRISDRRSQAFRSANRNFKRAFRAARREAWRGFVKQSFSDVSGRTLWGAFKRSRGSSLPRLVENPALVASQFAAAHLIPDALLSEIVEEKVPIALDCPDPVEDLTCVSEVESIIRRLPSKSSPGPDNVPYSVIKLFSKRTLEFLTALFNACLRQRHFPVLWRTARVVPLPKSSGGYRPISLLSNVSKVFERILLLRLKEWLLEFEVIPAHQFAFRKGAEAAVSSLLNAYPVNLVKYAVFFDVKKAFDRVHHNRLLSILRAKQCPSYLVSLLESFLSGRNAYVSSPEFSFHVVHGVPQGSVLGPVLFQIYISEFLANLPCYSAAYADDLVICHAHADTQITHHVLSEALGIIHLRSLEFGLEFDVAKTKAFWFKKSRGGSRAREIPLSLGRNPILYASQYRYLGVVLDNRLSFRVWISSKLEAVEKRSKLIQRLSYSPRRVQRVLYRGYVESYLCYGLKPVLPFLAPTYVSQLDSFIGRAAKRISGLMRNCSASSARSEAGLLSVQQLMSPDRKQVALQVRRLRGVDFASASCRNAEILFARLRTGFYYTNHWKYVHHLRDDADCRYCGLDAETLHHLLFDCVSFPVARGSFWNSVSSTLELDVADISVDLLLGISAPLSPNKLRSIARAIHQLLLQAQLYL